MRERGGAELRDVLTVGICAGLVMGLVEGGGLLLLHRFDLLAWDTAKDAAVSIQIVWAATLFGALVTSAAALGAWGLARIVPRLRAFDVALFLCVTLVAFNWIGLSGRMERTPVGLLSLGIASVITRWASSRRAMVVAGFRKALPWVAVAAILAAVGVEGGLRWSERQAERRFPPAPEGTPNVLVIVVDTLRADHLSAYGYHRPTSPNLDRFAAEGALFTQAFAGSSWTLPSHASLVTGRFLYEHGVEWRTRLDDKYPTIGEAMLERGYRTAAFSANLLFFSRRLGFGRGFCRFEDSYHSWADIALRTYYGRQVERSVFPVLEKYVLTPLAREDYPTRKRAPEVNRALLAWIDRDRSRPFFAVANYFDVHDPYVPPQPFRTRFAPPGVVPGGILNSRLRHPDARKLTPAELQSEIDGYDGAISYVDHHLGELFRALDDRGLTHNTMIVVTSDHGESFGEHGLVEHRNSLYREVVRVPLLVRFPGRVPAGLRIQRPVTNVSLPATIVEVSGRPGPTAFPGPSLAALWSGGDAPASPWPYPLTEIAQQPFEPYKRRPVYSGSLRAVISPEWHYIEHSAREPELYRPVDGVAGTENVLASDEGREAAGMLARYLKEQYSSPRPARPAPLSTGAGAADAAPSAF